MHLIYLIWDISERPKIPYATTCASYYNDATHVVMGYGAL